MTESPRSAIIKAKPIGHGLDAFRDSSLSLSEELNSCGPATVLDRIGRDVVLDNRPDTVIWEKVYELLAELTSARVGKSTTPPPSEPPHTASFQQTPWSFNTGSFEDTSDLRKNVDPILRSEVEDNLRIDHPDVFDVFFGQIQGLDDVATAVLSSCKGTESPLFQENIGWTEWPESCEETAVLHFLHRHIAQLVLYAAEHGFRPSNCRRCVTTPNKPIPRSISKRKLDVGFAYNSRDELEESSGQSYDWSHILIPGELKSNPREDSRSSTWLDLVRYAREIFIAQDTRRFVLGFTLCGAIMRLWEFDRLGVIGSTPFDINESPEMFVGTILGCLWMSEEELGFDPTIVQALCHGSGDDVLERLPSRRIRSRVGGQRFVGIRRAARRRSTVEGGDRSWSRERGAVYHHETVLIRGKMDDVRDNVRQSLSDTAGRNPLRQRATHAHSISSPITSDTSSARRGRSRSRSRHHSTARKRSSSSVQTFVPPPKRSCSDSPVKQDMQRRRNRIHRRLVMQDVALANSVGHESLLDAKILHRDISVGNVMLTAAENDGFLIDLDLAIKIDRENASGAPSKTGTKVFMAIGALYGEEHNFMHDLESFFWVLFWTCIHCPGPGGRRRVSKFEAWNFETTENLAKIKAGSVLEEDKFSKEVDDSCTAYCSPLVSCLKELRKIVFPDGKRWMSNDRRLYARMRSVLLEAKETLGGSN
ncbi:hypothetical protein B0J11DRAFT_598982 [Dendryphion nanum]|uniref:non-specific serine/threonine protein kinase n=1 Tax=Dendryphion nanum TaxID=256645 RepID=A0A9P9D1R0_9PLEO|nr:hypothetical protein B0J11DRAFT_598982 [Dendryphion nanum]